MQMCNQNMQIFIKSSTYVSEHAPSGMKTCTCASKHAHEHMSSQSHRTARSLLCPACVKRHMRTHLHTRIQTAFETKMIIRPIHAKGQLQLRHHSCFVLERMRWHKMRMLAYIPYIQVDVYIYKSCVPYLCRHTLPHRYIKSHDTVPRHPYVEKHHVYCTTSTTYVATTCCIFYNNTLRTTCCLCFTTRVPTSVFWPASPKLQFLRDW